jgi:DNA-directed RNA polymerase specialized sigma subunit
MTSAQTALPRGIRETGTPMSPTNEALLFARHIDGDLAAREALVRRFMPLARSLARRYDRS